MHCNNKLLCVCHLRVYNNFFYKYVYTYIHTYLLTKWLYLWNNTAHKIVYSIPLRVTLVNVSKFNFHSLILSLVLGITVSETFLINLFPWRAVSFTMISSFSISFIFQLDQNFLLSRQQNWKVVFHKQNQFYKKRSLDLRKHLRWRALQQ